MREKISRPMVSNPEGIMDVSETTRHDTQEKVPKPITSQTHLGTVASVIEVYIHLYELAFLLIYLLTAVQRRRKT